MSPPCFAIPVFRHLEDLYVQEISAQNMTESFVRLGADQPVISVPGQQGQLAQTGGPALMAFVFDPSNMVIADAERMRNVLLNSVHIWSNYIFLALDVWEFLEDHSQIDKACLRIANAIGSKNLSHGARWLMDNRPKLFQKWYTGDVEAMIRSNTQRSVKQHSFQFSLRG